MSSEGEQRIESNGRAIDLPDDLKTEWGDVGELIETLDKIRGARARIVEVLHVADRPLPGKSIESHGDLSKNTAPYHLKEASDCLTGLGLVEKVGTTRVRGHEADTWALTNRGERVAEAASHVDNLRAMGGTKDIDPAMQSLDSRLSDVETRLSAARENINEHFDTVEEHLRDVHRTANSASKTANSANKTADEVDRRLATLRDDVTENIEEIEDDITDLRRVVETERDDRQTKHKSIDSRLSKLEEWAGDAGAKMRMPEFDDAA